MRIARIRNFAWPLRQPTAASKLSTSIWLLDMRRCGSNVWHHMGRKIYPNEARTAPTKYMLAFEFADWSVFVGGTS
jgi:hypothetical protein